MRSPRLTLRFARPMALLLAAGLFGTTACASSGPSTATSSAPAGPAIPPPALPDVAPDPDPRVGLGAGLFDAEEAIWNLSLVSATPPPEEFVGVTNSDLAFLGDYAIQGNYNGFQVWDIGNASAPSLVTGFVCPASQSDVSVYENLLFISGEGMGGRLDCGTEGVREAVSEHRLRGIRIFDITDIRNPEYVGNVQTCRGSHTHSLLVDPDDSDNVYVYVSGSAPVRPAEELPGCSAAPPNEDPNSALFRIEVIRVPLSNPERAEIVSSPRIFEDLVAPPRHGPSEADLAEIERQRQQGAFVIEVQEQPIVLPPRMVGPMLDSIMQARGGSGTPSAADSTELRESITAMIEAQMGARDDADTDGPAPGPTQCHDITLYPEIGLAGGACEGYGLLLDISDPANPRRMHEVADSNFAYWHSATFNNDGTAVLFSDEWGGGGGPKCREGDPMEWGANAIFTIENGRMVFQSYYKLPAPQTSQENCVAHNGSLIPIPGRDVMVQSWYQGGVSVFDWTDPANPTEIAFFDRGPADATRMASGGTWSAYWYNGQIVSSEIARGLDILDLVPSPYLTENEIAAAATAEFDHFNPQGQQQFDWPPSFALARSYVDQLERTNGLSSARITEARAALQSAEQASGSARRNGLNELADHLELDESVSGDAAKVRTLVAAVRDLAAAGG